MRGGLGDVEFEELRVLYSSKGRFYHTLDHLAEMLQLGAPLGLDLCQVGYPDVDITPESQTG